MKRIIIESFVSISKEIESKATFAFNQPHWERSIRLRPRVILFSLKSMSGILYNIHFFKHFMSVFTFSDIPSL